MKKITKENLCVFVSKIKIHHKILLLYIQITLLVYIAVALSKISEVQEVQQDYIAKTVFDIQIDLSTAQSDLDTIKSNIDDINNNLQKIVHY